ncbi:alpha/beta hydrolase [Sphingomonas faeni]|uniref:alpha/beta hydrolase n=1 Tax=Sphingomonas faeni TaxID=185950 RepID=UPI00335E17ED
MTLSSNVLTLLASWQDAATDVVRAVQGDGTLSLQEARDGYFNGLEALLPSPDGVRFETVEMDGVPAMLVTPDVVEDGRALFYMHGGGYVHGAPRAYRGLAGHYAKKLRAQVYVPDYRQAPEFPFPTPIDDTFRAYRALFEMGHNPSQIAVSGDSAGGALVVTIMRKARDAGVPMPVAGVAISPWADLAHAGPSARTRDGLDPLCSVEFLDRLARLFLAGELATHPDASPVHADVRGLSPILIQMGENEVMLSGGIALAERLAEQRVRVTLEVWPGMFHVWHSFAGQMAEADEALDNAVHFLNREYARADQQRIVL